MPNEVGADFHSFHPYHYGPFASSIYNDADLLVRHSLATESSSGYVRRYAPTEAGLRMATELRETMPASAVHYLAEVVAWAQSLSFQDLIKAIYAKYPGTDSNSIFRY